MEQNLELEYTALLELETGKTNKEVAQLFDVPANTLRSLIDILSVNQFFEMFPPRTFLFQLPSLPPIKFSVFFPSRTFSSVNIAFVKKTF